MRTAERYEAYVDDSSSAEDGKVLVLAGYIQKASIWTLFAEDWKTELAKPPAIAYCHMTEAESLKGEFLGWDRTSRDQKIAALARVIVKHEPWSIECHLSKASHAKILEPVIAYNLRGPYFPCFYGVLVTAARYHAHKRLTSPIDFIFDKQGKIGTDALLWYEVVKQMQPREFAVLMGSRPQFKDDKQVVSLQAADMIAWHLRRRKEKRNVDERRAVMDILSPLTHVESEIDEGVLRRWAREMSALPYIASVQGKKGSIKKHLVGGRLPPVVTLKCDSCRRDFETFQGLLGATVVRCPFCGATISRFVKS